MTKCKHKGECICGKHSKEEIEYITIGGVDYIQTTVDYGVWGEVTFLSLVEEPEDSCPSHIEIDLSKDKVYKKSNKQTQKPNQVYADKAEEIKS